MPSWEVYYRAVADFTALTTAAAKARDELKLTAEEAKREGAAEKDAATQAAAAHDLDTAAIKRQRDALVALAAAAKASSEAQRGGASSPDAHLSSLQRETELQRLLNIQRQRGFTTPQQDLSYRQQELTQQRLWNIASQGGYANRDQFLQSMRQETAYRQADNASWAQRAVLLKSATDAVADHTSAVTDTKSAVSDLGQSLGSNTLDLSAYDTAKEKVSALKAEVHDLGNELRNASSGLSSSEFVSRLTAIQAAAKELTQAQRTTGGGAGGAQVSGLNQVLKDVQELSAEGGRSFDDLETKGRSSASNIGQQFAQLTARVGDVFRGISTTAGAEADKAQTFWGKAAAGIKGALEGLASGGGGGWSKVFESLAGTAGAAVESFFTGFGAIILGIIQLLPELTAGFAAVGASLAALPGLAAAAAAGFGIYLAAIQPVIVALQAFMQVEQARETAAANPQQTQMQLAQQQHAVADAYFQVQQAAYAANQQQITGAHAVADAKFAESQAVVQGANQEVNAAHSVTEAQFNLKQAYFTAAMQQVQSAMQVAGAQHSLQDANFAVSQSQYQLNMAWQQARFQLDQLELTVSGASLNLRGAQLGLEQAQQNYEQTIRNSTSTALERAQAAYQVQEAEQQLKQVELTNKENEKQLADVRKYGAQQVFGVTQAQHALTDAQFSQVQAQKQLVVVQKQAADAQIVAAHQIADAVFALQQAFFNQGQTVVNVHHNIADSQFALYQAQQQQTQGAVQSYHQQKDAAFALQTALLQQKLGIPAVASAQQQLNYALGQLGPYGQKAVKLLEPLLKWFNDFTGASDAFWKALQPALQGVNSLIKPISDFMTTVSGAAGSVVNSFVTSFEKFANSPAWDTFTQSTADIITNIGSGIVTIVEALGKLAIAAAPFTDWVAKGFASIAQDFANWLSSAEKSGDLTRFLNATEQVLKSIGQLGKGVLTFFEDLMGTTTGQRISNMQAFSHLLTQIAQTILPSLSTVLRQLSQPALRDALINLLSAVAKLLATIVQTPAFAFVVKTILDGLAAVFNLVSKVAGTPGVGASLGAIVGAFTALGVLKFTHLTDLLGLLFKLPGLKLAPDWLKGIFGVGGKSGAGLDSSAEALTGAAGDLSAAAADLSASAGTQKAGGAAGAVGGVAGGTAEGGFSLAALLGGALRAAGVLGVADIVAHALTNLMPHQVQGQADASQQQKGIGAPFAWLDKKIYGPKIDDFVAYWDTHVKAPVDNWFLHTLPNALNDNAFKSYWNSANALFIQYVQDPVGKFFGTLLPDWLGAANKGWGGLVTDIQNIWNNDIVGSVGKFFTSLLPDWLGGAGQGWKGLWTNAQNLFNNDIWQPLDNFFTNTIPGWFGDIGQFWSRLWDKGWSDFQDSLLHPVENWFTKTLPSAIAGAFKDGINWVINNVINKVIGWINDIVGKIPGVPHIRTVGTVGSSFADGGALERQQGGMIPLAGGGPRQDNRMIFASDGEFVVNAAATRRHRPLIEAINNSGKYASGGEIVNYADQFVGKVPYVWGGTSPQTGWDCSGFVWDIYRHFGINPPRTSEEQFNWVKRTKAPQVGGLAFGAGSDGSVASPGHVGIIVGPNRMVDAYGTGYGTRFDSISGSMGPVSGFGIPPGQSSGLFGTITDFGKSALGAFEHVFGNAVHGVESLLRAGALKSFNWLWGHTVVPLERQFGLTGTTDGNVVGSFAAKGLDNIRQFVDHLLSNASQTGAHDTAGPTTADAAVAQQYARARLGFYGWGMNQWPALQALWEGESGWSRFAQNQSSGAFGIPQALPFTKMPKKAWPVSAGGDAAAGPQIDWGMGYIKGTYGDPVHTYDLWLSRSPHWYAAGGPVGLAPGEPPDPNLNHVMVSWLDDVNWPQDKPSPGLWGGGDVGDPQAGMFASGGFVVHHDPDPVPNRETWAREWEALADSKYNFEHDWRIFRDEPWGGKRSRDSRKVDALAAIRENFRDAWQVMSGKGFKQPSHLNQNDWITLNWTAQQLRKGLLEASSLHSRHPQHYNMVRGALHAFLVDEADAAQRWQDIYGSAPVGKHGPGPEPLPNLRPVSLPNVLSMITGGPAQAALTPGFAGGGRVGFPMSVVPSMSLPSMSVLPSLALGRAGGGSTSSVPDRQLSDAAATTGQSSLFRDVIVNNPVPEPAGASITRNVMRLAFLAGRGPV